MGNKTRAAGKVAREKAQANKLIELKTECNGRTYSSWERANAAYGWCFPDVFMPEKYTEDDSIGGCEMAVAHFLSLIDTANNSHPVKQVFFNLDARTQAFDVRYPTDSTG